MIDNAVHSMHSWSAQLPAATVAMAITWIVRNIRSLITRGTKTPDRNNIFIDKSITRIYLDQHPDQKFEMSEMMKKIVLAIQRCLLSYRIKCVFLNIADMTAFKTEVL